MKHGKQPFLQTHNEVKSKLYDATLEFSIPGTMIYYIKNKHLASMSKNESQQKITSL